MSEDPKVIQLPSRASRKIAELNQALQQIGNRLLQNSPEAQNLLGQLAVWKEIEAMDTLLKEE